MENNSKLNIKNSTLLMDGDVVSTYADVTAVDIQLTLKEEIKEALVIVNG